MSETKSIHDVAAMVGIDRKTSEQILADVRSNLANMERCPWHDFSICVSRYGDKVIENPTPAERFGAKWKCSRCGGVVGAVEKRWYMLGQKHGSNLLALTARHPL